MNTPALDLFVKKIDTGGYSFARIREEDCYYVDKTLLIKDIFDNNIGGIYLFTRPRRFGKTLNLSMIDAYFNINYRGNTWFDSLAISEHPELDGYKNSFPVIHMDLRNAKTGSNQTYEDFIEKIGVILYGIFDRFRYLLESDKTDDDKKALFEKILRMDISPDQMQMSIPMLCSMLRMYHGKKVIVLIDEYDRAVSDSFGSESHRPILDFLGGFLEPILKNNPDVQMAYVTGVMQIAKESIFSGINNITVNNTFSVRSDERFGFTETEEGNGRVDMIMIPKAEGTTPIILELKKVDSENHLDKGLDEAMGQIHEKKYHAGMKGETILIAIAFWGKFPRIRTETVDPATAD